ncbi:transposase [Roseobacter fucihabitans]
MRSIAKLLGVEIAAPSFSTLSRRGNGLTLRVPSQANNQAGIRLVVDSTGLKMFGAGALSAACYACACRVRNGLKQSTKLSANGAPGASCTSASIWRAARSFAPI